jgi:hypothetical protein
MSSPFELSLRFERKRLASASPPAGDFVELLAPEAPRSAHRIVELWGDAPFDVSLSWTAGTSTPKEATFSVSRGARVGVFARTLVVKAANLSCSENLVGVAISDGFLASRNRRQLTGTGTGSFVELSVPAYAETLRLELSDPAQLSSARIALEDGFGTRVAVVAGDAQPDGGVPVGAAGKALVLVPAGVAWRALFTLSL